MGGGPASGGLELLLLVVRTPWRTSPRDTRTRHVVFPAHKLVLDTSSETLDATGAWPEDGPWVSVFVSVVGNGDRTFDILLDERGQMRSVHSSQGFFFFHLTFLKNKCANEAVALL